MKRKNTTRNALVTSIISMLLCVSMLVGTTFAWFTDEVVTGMNTIAAGNLDIELLADGVEVDSNTKLFSKVEKWEPGVVVYENLQVANVGTLALRYQLSLNFGNENDLNGHKLSEVLKIAVIDKMAENATRAEVLEAAKASEEVGTLASFRMAGELLPGEKSDEQTFVIFWEPNDNAIDNLYNVNNGQQTSDGEPLHIEFGVNLQATQLMHEEDSFGNDYDFVGFKPVAEVNGSTDLEIQATTNDMGSNAVATTYVLNAAYQFKPTETYKEAQNSPYRYWHADFVVKADKDVPANSMALAGYYQAFCDGYNNGNWVALTAGETIAAGTEIRLVDVMGNGSISVNYEELCLYADITDPTNVGFMCGAADLTGENAGTTITVELRMYETTGDPLTTTGSKNEETGEYITVGKYEFTFPHTNETVQMQIDNATEGETVQLPDGHWGNLVVTNDGITILGGENVVVDSINLNGSENVTLKGINFDAAGAQPVADGKGVTRSHACVFGATTGDSIGARNIVIDDCTFTGTFANGGAAIAFVDRSRATGGSGNITIQNCNFATEGAYYDVYGYYTGTVGMTFTMKNNTFASQCQGLPVYLGRLATSEAIVVQGNVFKTTDSIENSVYIQAHSGSYTPTLDAADNTFEG